MSELMYKLIYAGMQSHSNGGKLLVCVLAGSKVMKKKKILEMLCIMLCYHQVTAPTRPWMEFVYKCCLLTTS